MAYIAQLLFSLCNTYKGLVHIFGMVGLMSALVLARDLLKYHGIPQEQGEQGRSTLRPIESINRDCWSFDTLVKGYQEVLRGTQRYRGVPKGTKGIERYQRVPTGTKVYQEDTCQDSVILLYLPLVTFRYCYTFLKVPLGTPW